MRRLAATRALFGAGFLLATLAHAAPPVKLDGLPAADFAKLGPDALLDYAGRVLTKSQLLAELESLKRRGATSSSPPSLASARATLASDEKAGVEASNAALRSGWPAIAANAPVAAGGPLIARIEGLPLRDDGEIRILGSGFGAAAGLGTTGVGRVHVLGPFPGGHVALSTCSGGFAGEGAIVGCLWKPHAIETIHQSITGIPDQQLQVVVITAKGERSPPFPAPFRAKRILLELTGADVSVSRSNLAEGPCDSTPAIGTIACTAGTHHPGTWHIGLDRITAKVANGWTFDPHSSATVATSFPGAGPGPLGGEGVEILYGADKTTVTVFCTYAFVGMIPRCEIDLVARGPEGVAYK